MECQWTPDEKSAVDAAFLALCELHRQQVSVALTRIYYRSLEAHPAGQVIEAIERAISTFKWFPKPVELLDLINGDPEEQAIKAWTHLQAAVSRIGTNSSVLFEDPKITMIVKSYGGWDKIGEWPERFMDKRRDEFIASYKATKNPPPTEKLHGRSENPALLRGYPNLTPWAIVKRNGEIVRMTRMLASNGSEILDLPEPPYALPKPEKPSEDESTDLIPVSTFIPKLMGAFR